MYAVASLGVISVIYKFFPYYSDNLKKKDNDLYTWALIFPIIGFLLTIAGGILFEPLIVRKFSGRSPLFVDYYHWIFIFGFGILIFTVLEGFSWTLRKTIYPNFLRETGLRFLGLLLILLFYFGVINFDSFIKLFSFQFLLIACLLALALYLAKDIALTFKISRVTQKFKKKMFSLAGYVYGGAIIIILSQVADSIIIASVSKGGLHDTGVYNLATYIATLIQVPQRSIVAVTIPVLSIAWKNKNLAEIDRIYKRSSINLLLLGLFIFIGVWLNIKDAFHLLHIQAEYEAGILVVLILGITKLIDAGTGVNGQIIATSTQWRFEFITGVLLILLILPLNYFLVKKMGIMGSAFANLISFSIYNLIRFVFLWKKYNLQPFNNKTLLSILLGVAAYFISYFLFRDMQGWMGVFLRSTLFTLLFFAGVFTLKLTPDAMQLVEVAKKRFGSS
jgi:O-antigen/teichoic acid export membrane protein